MDPVPDTTKSLAYLSSSVSREYVPITGQTPFRDWKRHLVSSINKLLQTQAVMNYRTISPYTSLLGFTLKHQVLIQHPRGQNAIALLPNIFVQIARRRHGPLRIQDWT
jgi:hypothetical protein